MTIHSVTDIRFKAILDAYGADSARWPLDEREAALTWQHDNAATANAWISEAKTIDALLDSVPEAGRLTLEDSRSLHWRTMTLLAQHMPPANIVALRPRPRSLSVIWATGIGIAACIAGALLGVNVSMSSLGDLRAQTVLEQAQMIDSDTGNG